MDITVAKNDQGVSVRPEGDLLVRNVKQFLDQVLAADLDGERIIFDLEGVSEIDTAGIQAFLFLKKHLEQGGRKVVFLKHPNAVIAIMDLYGLIAHFGDRVYVRKKDMELFAFAYGVRKSEIMQEQ